MRQSSLRSNITLDCNPPSTLLDAAHLQQVGFTAEWNRQHGRLRRLLLFKLLKGPRQVVATPSG